MHISPYYQGLSTLENMTNPKNFIHHLSMADSGWRVGSLPINIADIYFSMGADLKDVFDNVKHQVSWIFEHDKDYFLDSSKFKKLQEFLANDSFAHIQKYSRFNIFTSRSDEEAYTDYFNDVDREYRNLLKIIKMKSQLSFNKIVNYWENVISPSVNFDMSIELKELWSVANKYYTSSAYKDILAVLEESKNFSLSHLFFSKNKITKADVDKFKNFINKLMTFAQPRNKVDFFDTKSLNDDISIIQSILLSFVNKHPEIFDSCDLDNTMAVKFMKSPFSIDLTNYYCTVIAQNFPLKGPYYSVTFFVDYSILVQKSSNSKFELLYDFNMVSTLANNAFSDYLKFTTRKTPTVSKHLLNAYQRLFQKNISDKFSDDGMFLYNFSNIVKYYVKYEPILKLKNFNIIDVFNESNNQERFLEWTSDRMYNLVKNHNIDKYSKSIFSNKYKHLSSEQLLPIFTELFRLEVPCSYIQDNIGKKMASFKTAVDLYHALENVLNLLDNFSFEIIKEKAIKINAEIISESNNKILIRIKNFEESKLLGSSSWCISRDEYYFTQYTQNNNEQYFLYDFNKISRDNHSLIGCTLTDNSKLTISHLKNDFRIEKDEQIDYIVKKVKQYKMGSMPDGGFVEKIRKIVNSIKVFT